MAVILDHAEERVDCRLGLPIIRVQLLRRQLRRSKAIIQLLWCPLERGGVAPTGVRVKRRGRFVPGLCSQPVTSAQAPLAVFFAMNCAFGLAGLELVHFGANFLGSAFT